MSSPVNTITYGSVTFPFASLTSNSGVIYAEDGFTRVGRRWNFVVKGWIGGINQGDLSTKLLAMQQVLHVPRLNFRVHWDGDGSTDLFFYVPATGGTPSNIGADIDWGPKPGELNLTKFAGGRVAMYEWTVSVNTMDAPVKSDVLAVTWQFSHVVDASGLTTRTVRGKILVNSGIVATGQGADYYRNVVTGAVPQLLFFRRDSQEYTQSEDGRILSFSITDTETNYSLPKPITSGHASWMVRVHGIGEEGALNVDYILSGWFESSAAHGKQDILNAIFNLFNAKFGAANSNKYPMIFTERVLREDVYGRNRIDFSFSAVQPGGAKTGEGSNQDIDPLVGLQTFGIQPPDSDGNYLIPNPYGETDNLTSGAYAPAPHTYDADPPTGVDQGGGYNFFDAGDPGLITPKQGSKGKPVPPSTTATVPQLGGISDLHQSNPFVAFHEVISYEFDNHMVMLTPKMASAAPFVQQTGVPTLTIIQAGYSKQIAKKASDIDTFGNQIAFLLPDFVLSKSYVSTPNAEPIADGVWQVFTTEWRYVFLKNAQPTNSDTLLLPLDPRRGGDAVIIEKDQYTDTVITPQ